MLCWLQSLGWVEAAACRPYTSSAADSALVSVMPEVAAGGYRPGEDSASHAVCARALKLAAQYNHVNDVQQVGLLTRACNLMMHFTHWYAMCASHGRYAHFTYLVSCTDVMGASHVCMSCVCFMHACHVCVSCIHLRYVVRLPAR